MRIALLGAPGAGKEIQANLIAKRYKIVNIVMTELLREAARARRRSRRAITLDTMLAVLEVRLRARDCKRGFILHDFPRDIPEAQGLDAALGVAGKTLQIAVHLKAADEVLQKRMVGRMRCTNKSCAALYNRFYSPPKARNVCDRCGEKVLAASEARQAAAETKIREYHTIGDSLLAYYKAQHKLRTVPLADADTDTCEKICELIDLEIRPLEIDIPDAYAHNAAP